MMNPPLQDPYHLHFWHTLGLTPGLSVRQARALADAAGGLRDLRSMATWLAERDPALSHRLLDPSVETSRQLEASWRWASAPSHHLISIDHPCYPEPLAQLADAPLVLYVDGDPRALVAANLAIVGSRNASRDGIDLARSIAREIAGQGWCIASGLASGIDVAAHLGALDGGGWTVAVIGTGIDRCYPERHQRVARQVAEHGAVVSELPLGSPPLAHHFPMRNRLIAGLAKGVLVVQAARRSGSLITARLALDYGREVMAVPGSVHTPLHKGCHHLIREGALLVQTGAEVLEALGGSIDRGRAASASVQQTSMAADCPGLGAAHRGALTTDEGASDEASERLLQALGWSPVAIDGLETSNLHELAELPRRLLELELAGRVVRLTDGRLQRVR